MAIHAYNIIILVLLIALVTPTVNAINSDADPVKLVANLQFNDSQTKQNLNDGFLISADNTKTAGSPNGIPAGSTIYHRNGVTRIFDSDGKQLSIIDDTHSHKIATPAGLRPASKVYQVPNGALIRRDGEITQVILKNSIISTIINAETADLQIPTSDYSWIESAHNDSIPNLGRFYAEWTVPDSPSNTTSPAIDFLFTAIQPKNEPQDGTLIIQPVIEWNNGMGHIWQGRAWYVTTDATNNTFKSNPINISSGHSVTGLMEWNTDTQNWTIIITDNTLSQSMYIDDHRFTSDDFRVFGGVLETYNINDKSDIPGTTHFANMQFRDTDNQPVNFNWEKYYNNATLYALPGLYVDTISQSQVTLYTDKQYTITPSHFPPGGGSTNPASAVSVFSGSNYTVMISPNTSYYIHNVTVNGVSVGNVSNYTFTNVQHNSMINVSFAPQLGTNYSGSFVTPADRRQSVIQSDYIIDCTDVPVYWDGTGRVSLFSPELWGYYPRMGADDQLVVTTRNGSLTFTGRQYLGQPDITSIMRPGLNYITLRTNDLIYGWVGLNVDVWIRAQSSLKSKAEDQDLESKYLLAIQNSSNQSTRNTRNMTSDL
jgi:hypothetical protein